ncbi:MAG: YdeI family protein [Marinoscillum sp.]
MSPSIDAFFSKNSKWQDSYHALREILLQCNLHEALKWGKPCYTLNGQNVVLIHGFKEYCALLFHKGVLLKDKEGILVQQTENVQAARQLRFTNEAQIIEMKATIKAYILKAIQVEQSGMQVKFKKTSEFPMPEEFRKVLEENSELISAFDALTPGRQRGYLLHFSQPKQSKTRESRIEKSWQAILEGKGLNDR